MAYQIRAKARRPSAVGYNGLIAIPLAATNLAGAASANIASSVALGLNVKVLAVSLAFNGAATGSSVTANVVSGAGAYQTPGSAAAAATATITQVGNDPSVSGEIYTLTIAGTTYTWAAPGAGFGKSNAVLNLSSSAQSDPNCPVNVTTSGVTYTFTAKTAGTAGNSIAVSTGDNKTGNSGTSYLTGGTNAVVAVLPVQAPSDNTYAGVVPPVAAAPGQTLFALDQAITPTANGAQVLYPLTGFDSIFPSGSLLTLRLTDVGGNAAGTVQATLWAVPVDRYPQNPQNQAKTFVPGPTVL